MSDSGKPIRRVAPPAKDPAARLTRLAVRARAAAAAIQHQAERRSLYRQRTRGVADALRSSLALADGLPAGAGMVVRVRVFAPEDGEVGVIIQKEARRSHEFVPPTVLAEVHIGGNADGSRTWFVMDGQTAPAIAVYDLVVGRIEQVFDSTSAEEGDPCEEIPF